MDALWISVAFVFGFVVRQVGLPPLVGFLVAGFVLNAFGVEGGETLHEIADLGVLLLLFSIGLKLKLRSLARPEVWAGTSVHMLITVLVFGLGIHWLAASAMPAFSGLDLNQSLLLAFALSFSSTVFAVKVFEEKGEMLSRHGSVAIGILIMQDIIAIFFLAGSTGKVPSPWALALLALLPFRRVLIALLERTGHGELLILYGLVLAIGGAGLFEFVGLKPDLGALILGILIAGAPKASELAGALLAFKDLLLVGFFLSIGLSGVPSYEALGIALLLAVLMPLKVALFFVLLTRFRLRARTALLASLSLGNYSEFGLIVGAIGVSNGWIPPQWLVIIAIALSITFVVASPLNSAAQDIYARVRESLKRLETKTRLPDDLPIGPGPATIAILGMGRVGTAAYDIIRQRYGETIIAVDRDPEAVQAHQAAGRNVILGDATDYDFWARIDPGKDDRVGLVMLTMPNHTANMLAIGQMRRRGYSGLIAATARYPDEVQELEKAGAQAAFNIYGEAGVGFAEHVCERLDERLQISGGADA